MTYSEEIKAIISRGESTTVQFKVRLEDAYKVGTEMTAFSNGVFKQRVASDDAKLR